MPSPRLAHSRWLFVLAFAMASGLGSFLTAQSSPDIRRDAERGDPAAQYRLGLAYRDGAGETKDLVEAYRWITLAAARATSDQAAAFTTTRNGLVPSMTLAQIAEAQKRARAWQDAFAPGRPAGARSVMAATPAADAGPLRADTDIPAPAQTRHVQPVYPDLAQRARVQGSVILDATISPEGRVTSVQVLRSIPMLHQAAIDAVKQWEFAPTVVGGTAVPVIMTVTVTFTLK